MRNFIKYIFFVALIFTAMYCSDYSSSVEPVTTRGIHPDGWADKVSSNFHGSFLAKNNFDTDLCKTCHAEDFSGGTTGQACADCHLVHPNDFADSTAALPHFEYMMENGYPLKNCQFCHETDYSGGATGVACTQCHTSPAGPEACNTCHGDFNDTTGVRISPPRAVNDETSTSYRGVGAHLSHTFNNDLRDPLDCEECHIVPQSVFDPTHIDGTPHAEITFGDLAQNNVANPVFNSDSLKCSNVYCHGNFVFLKDSAGGNSWNYTDTAIVGNKFSPHWTQLDDTQAECGTCHDLPPKGHQNAGNDPTASTCGGCHVGIVDANGIIVGKDKHINGQKNVFGN